MEKKKLCVIHMHEFKWTVYDEKLMITSQETLLML